MNQCDESRQLSVAPEVFASGGKYVLSDPNRTVPKRKCEYAARREQLSDADDSRLLPVGSKVMPYGRSQYEVEGPHHVLETRQCIIDPANPRLPIVLGAGSPKGITRLNSGHSMAHFCKDSGITADAGTDVQNMTRGSRNQVQKRGVQLVKAHGFRHRSIAVDVIRIPACTSYLFHTISALTGRLSAIRGKRPGLFVFVSLVALYFGIALSRNVVLPAWWKVMVFL